MLYDCKYEQLFTKTIATDVFAIAVAVATTAIVTVTVEDNNG